MGSNGWVADTDLSFPKQSALVTLLRWGKLTGTIWVRLIHVSTRANERLRGDCALSATSFCHTALLSKVRHESWQSVWKMLFLLDMTILRGCCICQVMKLKHQKRGTLLETWGLRCPNHWSGPQLPDAWAGRLGPKSRQSWCKTLQNINLSTYICVMYRFVVIYEYRTTMNYPPTYLPSYLSINLPVLNATPATSSLYNDQQMLRLLQDLQGEEK